MDPLSITASSIAIITICSQVTNIVTKLVSNVRNIDSTITKLAKEVQILCTVLAAVNQTFERPGISTIIALNEEAQLWPCVSDILDNCRVTLRNLRRTLRELDSEAESSNLVQKGMKHFQLGKRKELITSLLGQVHSYHGMLQMLLQCTNICMTLHESIHNRAADNEILRELSTIRSEIHQLKDTSPSKIAPSGLHTENNLRSHTADRLDVSRSLDHILEKTIHSVEYFVEDSVSTVYARSASGSEASWGRSDHVPYRAHAVQCTIQTGSRQSIFEYASAPKGSSCAENLPARQDYMESSPEEKISDWETMAPEELLASLEALDGFKVHQLTMQASRCGANQLLRGIINVYGDDVVGLEDIDGIGWTPLHMATSKGHCSTVDLLLQSGANINQKDYAGVSPCMLAMTFGEEDAALLLLQRGANTTELLHPACHLLMFAAIHNCLRVMARVLFRGETEASTSFQGTTALHTAVIAGSLEAAKFLLDYGFNIEARDHGPGWTPLMVACCGILEKAMNGVKWTWSVRSKHTTLVRLLLDKGADINAVARNKMTPLRVAILYKRFDVIQLLLEYGVKQDIKSRLWLLAHAKDLGLQVEKRERAIKASRR